MNNETIQATISKLDTTDSDYAEQAWNKLKPLGESLIPYLVDFFPKAKKWQGRVNIVYYAIRYARINEQAFELGVAAMSDKSRVVRHRACGLLAYSLKQAALTPLRSLLTHDDIETVNDAKAAIDAIKNKNHHFFVDRTHSGRCFWAVTNEEKQEALGMK